MGRKYLSAFVLSVAGATLLHGQVGGPAGGREGFVPGGPGAGFGFHGATVVTGAPYSADVSNQSSQTLADGNTIARSTTGHVARDGQGRTYSQETITGGFFANNGPVTVTFISDPVAGYSYVLNTQNKTATRRTIKTAGNGESGPGGRRNNRAGNASTDNPNVTTADLGTQTISGVTATGKSRTHTVPAGAMGNAQPLVSTNETWYSADLQTVVLAKRSDSRFGQSTFSLTNIQRTEPPSSLFQVPSDYTVTDAKGPREFGPGGARQAGPPPQL